ncbi:hypothetical protein ISCGN_021929 [Ixodes scapularis]
MDRLGLSQQLDEVCPSFDERTTVLVRSRSERHSPSFCMIRQRRVRPATANKLYHVDLRKSRHPSCSVANRHPLVVVRLRLADRLVLSEDVPRTTDLRRLRRIPFRVRCPSLDAGGARVGILRRRQGRVAGPRTVCASHYGYHSGYAAHFWVPVESESARSDVARVTSPVYAPYLPVIPLELADLSTPPPSFQFCMPDTTRPPPPLPWRLDDDQATGLSTTPAIVTPARPLTRAGTQLSSGFETRMASLSLEDSRSSGGLCSPRARGQPLGQHQATAQVDHRTTTVVQQAGPQATPVPPRVRLPGHRSGRLQNRRVRT